MGWNSVSKAIRSPHCYMTKSSFLPLHVRLDMGNTLTPGRAISGMILRCRDNETCEMKRESGMPQWDVTAASWNDGSPQKCPLLSMWGIATNWSEKPWVLQGAFTHVLFKRDDVILFFINVPTLTPWYFSRSSENVTPQSRGVPKGNRMALVSLTFLKRTCVPCYYYNLDQRSTQIVKDHVVNIFWPPVTTTQPCLAFWKQARTLCNEWAWLCSDKTLFTNVAHRPDLAPGLWTAELWSKPQQAR